MTDAPSPASAAASVLASAAGTEQWKPVLRAVRRLRHNQSVQGLARIESELERMQHLLARRSLDVDHGQRDVLIERYRERLEQLLAETMGPDDLRSCARLLEHAVQVPHRDGPDFTVVPSRDPGKLLQVDVRKSSSPESQSTTVPPGRPAADVPGQRLDSAAVCAYSLLMESAVGRNWPILSDSSSRLPAYSFKRSEVLQALVAPPGRMLPGNIYGRRDILESLEDLTERPDGCIHVISGGPGSGKSFIAHAVAVRALEKRIRVWWVRCGTGYTHAAMSVIAFLLGANPRDLAEARAGRRSLPDLVWGLIENSSTPWLLVFDDCGQGDSSPGCDPTAWARPSRKGLVIITTRANLEVKGERRRTARYAIHEVSSESGAGLPAEFDPSPGSHDRTRQLSSVLGGLPLALSLSTSYLKLAGASAESFIAYYNEYHAAPLRKAGADPIQEAPKFLIRSILDMLDAQGVPQARPILQIIVQFAAGIALPEVLFESIKLGEFGLHSLSGGNVLQPEIQCGVDALQAAGLLERVAPANWGTDLKTSALQANPAIVEVCREQFNASPPSELRAIRGAAAASLNSAVARFLKSEERDWAGCQLLSSHIHSLLWSIRHGRPPEVALEQAADAACSVADFLLLTGTYQDAENLARAAYDVSNLLAEDHPVTLQTGICLASTLMARGRLGEAQAIIKHILAVRERVLGPGHPETLRVLEKLALCLRDQGRLREAELALRGIIPGRERLLSRNHAETLNALATLSAILWAQGKIGEAERCLRKVVEGRKAIVESSDPEVTSALSDLATILRDRGRLQEAEKALRRVLEVRERTLGVDDPDTLEVLVELAETIREQGRLGEAVMALQRVLEVRERTLGVDDPDTIAVIVELAETLREQGKPEVAKEKLQHAFNVQVLRLGASHPHVLNSQVNLAVALRDLGEWECAEKALRSAVAAYEETAGAEHPITLCAIHNLAVVLQDMGRFDEAEKLCKHVLDLREWTLGPNHPETLDTLANIGCLLRSRGALREAQDAISLALEGYEDLLGDDHPKCLTIKSNLAGVLCERGMFGKAEELHRIVLAGRTRMLGENHPDTLLARVNVAAGLVLRSRLDDAEELLQDTLRAYEGIGVSADVGSGRVSALYNLAVIYRRKWKLKEAESAFREVLDIRTKQFGSDHPDTLAAHNELARVLKDMGRGGEADREYENILLGAHRFVVDGRDSQQSTVE
jgi:tetratricopeptide (TPR) repeat protein